MDDLATRITRRFLFAMAHNRALYKAGLAKHLKGGLREYYKACLGRKTGYMASVPAWDTEVKKLLTAFSNAMEHAIQGFSDRGKAVQETIADVKSADERIRRKAVSEFIKKVPDINKLRVTLDDQDTAGFWTRVDETMAAERAIP
jgi:hypothetical protein